MELVEPAIIIGFAIGVSSVIIAIIQHRSQQKTTSVNVSMNILKRFENDDF